MPNASANVSSEDRCLSIPLSVVVPFPWTRNFTHLEVTKTRTHDDRPRSLSSWVPNPNLWDKTHRQVTSNPLNSHMHNPHW